VQLLEGSDARRVDLLTVTGSTGSMPVTVSAPTANWRIVWQNGRLIARRNRGVFVIVR
jgi:hypothetical protein